MPSSSVVLDGSGAFEVVLVDGLDVDAAQGSSILVADPEGGLPLTEVGDIELDGPGGAADGQVGDRSGVYVANPLGGPPAEPDRGMAVDVEEIGAAQVGVTVGFARPDCCGVDLPFEQGLHGVLGVELQPSVDVGEHATHPGDHHVAGAERGGGVTGFEDPSAHRLLPRVGPRGHVLHGGFHSRLWPALPNATILASTAAWTASMTGPTSLTVANSWGLAASSPAISQAAVAT